MKTKNKIKKEKFGEEYERNFLLMKKWNDKRAKSETEGLKKFHDLSIDPLLHPNKFNKT
jgi:hypothetical protein